ncbi:MAG: cytochrome c maturation protein CcmE [Bacteroidia bacterium]
MKPIQIAILIAVVVFGIALGTTYIGSSSVNTSFKDAKASGATAYIGGKWVDRENANYLPEKDVFTFMMQDSVGTTAQVVYHDPKPNNFEAAEKVMVVGKYNGEIFEAEKIITKCPSKYESKSITASK